MHRSGSRAAQVLRRTQGSAGHARLVPAGRSDASSRAALKGLVRSTQDTVSAHAPAAPKPASQAPAATYAPLRDDDVLAGELTTRDCLEELDGFLADLPHDLGLDPSDPAVAAALKSTAAALGGLRYALVSIDPLLLRGPFGVIITGADGDPELCNETWAELYGYTLQDYRRVLDEERAAAAREGRAPDPYVFQRLIYPSFRDALDRRVGRPTMFERATSAMGRIDEGQALRGAVFEAVPRASREAYLALEAAGAPAAVLEDLLIRSRVEWGGKQYLWTTVLPAFNSVPTPEGGQMRVFSDMTPLVRALKLRGIREPLAELRRLGALSQADASANLPLGPDERHFQDAAAAALAAAKAPWAKLPQAPAAAAKLDDLLDVFSARLWQLDLLAHRGPGNVSIYQRKEIRSDAGMPFVADVPLFLGAMFRERSGHTRQTLTAEMRARGLDAAEVLYPPAELAKIRTRLTGLSAAKERLAKAAAGVPGLRRDLADEARWSGADRAAAVGALREILGALEAVARDGVGRRVRAVAAELTAAGKRFAAARDAWARKKSGANALLKGLDFIGELAGGDAEIDAPRLAPFLDAPLAKLESVRLAGVSYEDEPFRIPHRETGRESVLAWTTFDVGSGITVRCAKDITAALAVRAPDAPKSVPAPAKLPFDEHAETQYDLRPVGARADPGPTETVEAAPVDDDCETRVLERAAV